MQRYAIREIENSVRDSELSEIKVKFTSTFEIGLERRARCGVRSGLLEANVDYTLNTYYTDRLY